MGYATLRKRGVEEVRVPDDDSSVGHWAAYLYQVEPGTYDDVADALGLTKGMAYGAARGFAHRNAILFPLQKKLAPPRRRLVRETIRGAP